MMFNPGDGTGIVDEINDICGTDNVTYPIASKTRRVNAALDEFYSIALMYDRAWHFDDTNLYEADGITLRELPIASTDINSGQQDYPFAAELLTVKQVYVEDSTGVRYELQEETEPRNTFLEPSGNTGLSTKYRLFANSILLDFVPNYSREDGLTVVFGRNGSKFTTTDTIKELGIPSLFHKWICEVASLPYLIEHRLPQKNDIAALIQLKKDPRQRDSIASFMSNRNQTKRPRLGIKWEDTQ